MTAPPEGPAHRSNSRTQRRRRIAWAVPTILGIVAVAVVATAVVVNLHDRTSTPVAGRPFNGATTRPTPPSTGHAAPSTGRAPTSGTSSNPPARPARVVTVTSLESDHETYGIGMPIVLYFSPVPTNPAAFEKAVQVTVNGRAANGAWFWEQPTRADVDAHIIEAHYRLANYWPADSTIHVAIPIGGLSAGRGLAYSDKLTSLDYHIGDAHVTTVDASTLTMHVTSNGKLVHTAPVSLGAALTPTYNGVKVVMQKGEDVPGTDELRPDGTVLMSGTPVQWSVRITQSGEYLHAAPWNQGIGQQSTSHGCTNLHTATAKWFYHFARIGDVVQFANTDGKQMPYSDGLGDWNLTWSQWAQGGLLTD